VSPRLPISRLSLSNNQPPGVLRATPDRSGPRRRYLLLVVSGWLLAVHAWCQTPAGGSVVTNLEIAQSRAAKLKQPLLVLVAESGASPADNRARALVDSLASKDFRDNTIVFSLDLAISRNRATAARFHVTNTPVLLCLSSQGIIISRDDGKITRRLVPQRVEEARRQSPDLDAQFARLEAAATEPSNNLKAQFALTDFLLAHQNDIEAIPRLEAIAHSDACAPAYRITAWVALARAHLWIAEPEKGRHEAEALLAALGPVVPEAQAGGELVLGLQDAVGKRLAVARKELQGAAAAAPESSYGKEAAKALAGLPQDNRTP